MFGPKSVYFYLIACQITLIKFFKKLYFSSKNYNKSLETKTPQQVYYSPNPFLLSIITSYKNHLFKISEIKKNLINIGAKKIDYIEKYNLKSFKKIKRNSKQFNLFFAYYIKNTRLIDNI